MTLFRTMVFTAALAGLLAGLVSALIQQGATVPLILKAETYEAAEAAPDHGAVGSHEHAHDAAGQADHAHGSDEWAPADGLERFAFTALANVLGAVGFALVLLALSELAGGLSGWREGLGWGLAAFAAVTLAPSLGLPPELPAMPVADLFARQAWWIGTAAATAGGIALLVFVRTVPAAVLAIGLIVLPHLIGAPQPESHDTAVPAHLAHEFMVAVTLASLVFWAVLGSVAGFVRHRFATSAA